MSSSGVTPDRSPGAAPPDGPAYSGLDRTIRALSWWWTASPLILLTPVLALATGFPGVRAQFGIEFASAALVGAVVAPVAGFVVAHVGHRRRARRRFTVMGAVSAVPILFIWVFAVLLAECPDGYHC
ncbi:hypothetical protein [Streptomyces sp. IB2014 016-6]|uniref:hypothetical protein n=1 Tax=Streptomyces sp. IB2014 016-6 TaxID=2517818 RepID=UPI0011CC175B|nr:hypothetical protein [Streptomyces sp. IB2014 016-6]TXL89972.1 hypothetical protein EW053_13215 [Streptomyces sp. IB2014 016-6]